MNRLKTKQQTKQLARAIALLIAALIIPCYILLTYTSSHAVVPAYAKITQILGPNDIGIRSGSQVAPAAINTMLNVGQQLVLSGSNRTFVQLDFYNSSNQAMKLAVQASTKNKLPTLYYFPCTIQQGDSLLIEWANREGQDGAVKKVFA